MVGIECLIRLFPVRMEGLELIYGTVCMMSVAFPQALIT